MGAAPLTHLVLALGACPKHVSVRQELAESLAVQLLVLLLNQLLVGLKRVEDGLGTRNGRE